MTIFERSGHFPYVEEPEASFSTVHTWVTTARHP
jgi:hypothetical protein